MTLNPICESVETAQGVAITVTGTHTHFWAEFFVVGVGVKQNRKNLQFSHLIMYHCHFSGVAQVKVIKEDELLKTACEQV